MKLSLAALAAVSALVAVSGAAANGSPFSPGLEFGWDGVLARDKPVRYVTLATENSTIVSVVRTRGGRIVRTVYLRGTFGVPLVAYDGTTGGLSGDGRRLVLGSYGPPPGQRGLTRFAILDTRKFRLRRSFDLDGSWSFDAVSPDGETLFLTQHIRAGKKPLYRVRPYDVASERLRGAIVDRLEQEAEMGGEPVARASSHDGRWAYTLYARRRAEPFVHALDTSRAEAFCIDLPLELHYGKQWMLRLKLRERDGALAVRYRKATLASVDTRSWAVEKESSP